MVMNDGKKINTPLLHEFNTKFLIPVIIPCNTGNYLLIILRIIKLLTKIYKFIVYRYQQA